MYFSHQRTYYNRNILETHMPLHWSQWDKYIPHYWIFPKGRTLFFFIRTLPFPCNDHPPNMSFLLVCDFCADVLSGCFVFLQLDQLSSQIKLLFFFQLSKTKFMCEFYFQTLGWTVRCAIVPKTSLIKFMNFLHCISFADVKFLSYLHMVI